MVCTHLHTSWCPYHSERWGSSKLHYRQTTVYASSSGNTAEGGNEPMAGNEVLERIRRAKQYRESKSRSSPANTSLEGMPQSNQPRKASPQASLDEYSQRMASQAESLAKQQEEVFTAALQSLEIGQDEPNTTSTTQQEAVNRPMAASVNGRGSRTLEAKLRNPDTRNADSRRAGWSSQGGQGTGPVERVEDITAINGEKKPASFLEEVMTQGQDEAADMRPEMYTILKEERQKAQGVEFITKDPNYNPNNVGKYTYKPKVSTWGVFPRPDNISKAFGGGRTYKPGEEPKVAQESKDRLAAALVDYRKKKGMFMEPEVEERCQGLFDQGMQMLQMGRLSEAALQFDTVIDSVPPGSKLGGEAQLQRAIALDSAGKHDDAYKIYLKLERHPANEVQKRAKRMLFGFRAADNLKVGTMSYAVGRKDYERYFTQLTGQWNSGYVADSEPDSSSSIIAAVVLTVPLLICLALILNR